MTKLFGNDCIDHEKVRSSGSIVNIKQTKQNNFKFVKIVENNCVY